MFWSGKRGNQKTKERVRANEARGTQQRKMMVLWNLFSHERLKGIFAALGYGL